MSLSRTRSLIIFALAGLAGCGPSREHERADSLVVSASIEQRRLAAQLGAQKDSLTRVVLQADDFITSVDSTVAHAIGSRRGDKGKSPKGQLDPLAQQLVNRRAMMARVDSLVRRAQATASQLARANATNRQLRDQVAGDSAMIADLNATIQRQVASINALQVRVDSLNGVTQQLGASLATLEAQHNKAFYVVGREDDLVKRGVVVREGGANLLFAHPGRTLQMARTVDPQLFVAVDQRGTTVIPMPDSSRRYRVISRQSLDYAAVDGRNNESFVGNLRISEPGKFWEPSRFLVIVEQ